MQFYTIGYGGAHPKEFQATLQAKGITTIVDVRLRPDRASMGCYAKAKSADKGIEKLLAEVGIRYVSLIELGNVFLECVHWQDLYGKLLSQAGDLLLERLWRIGIENKDFFPCCLLCAEKDVHTCHRLLIAQELEKRGWHLIEHLIVRNGG